jgi:WhiB family redox-sensing transcriptional regulator
MSIGPSLLDEEPELRPSSDGQVPPSESTLWMTGGACAGKTGMDWFPAEEFTSSEEVRAVCGACGVAGLCLSYALAHHEYGVWGGTTERERRALRKRARSHPPVASYPENQEGSCRGVA